MPRPGVAVPRGAPIARNGHLDRSRRELESWDEVPRSYESSQGVPGRRTVTITGQGAEGYATRNGTRASAAQRHRQVPRHQRAGFRPDRAAMWAVLLCVTLVLAAAASSHAAVLAHHALALH
jgi:hypothetical protein